VRGHGEALQAADGGRDWLCDRLQRSDVLARGRLELQQRACRTCKLGEVTAVATEAVITLIQDSVQLTRNIR
jgi:hypothetical protein